MNVIEAYLKYKGYHIILLSGYSGSHKTLIAKFLAKRFNYNYVNLSQFYYSVKEYDKSSNYEHYVIEDKKKYLLNWNNVFKSVDWTKFNEYVNNNKTKGIIISGFGFPASLIKFTATHIHIKINKENLLLQREKYVTKHDIAFDKLQELENILIEEQIMTKLKKESYDWLINMNKSTFDDATYNAFKYIIDNITAWLKKYKPVVTKKQPPKVYEEKVLDKFYHPNNKKLYDVNNQGYPYPDEFREKYNKKYAPSSTSSDAYSDDSSMS